MAVANEVEKRVGSKKAAAESGPSPSPSGSNGHPTLLDREVEIQRLRKMMLIRRFEERTAYEYTKPGQRSAGSAISTVVRKLSPSVPPPFSTNRAII